MKWVLPLLVTLLVTFSAGTCTSGSICFEPRTEVPTQRANMAMKVYRMEFVDLKMTDDERNFNYNAWYNASWNGSSNTFGGFVQQNTRGQSYVGLVNLDRDVFNSTFSRAAIMAALQAVLVQNPDADAEQLYFNAITNILLALTPEISTTSVYQIFAIQVPYDGQFFMAQTGMGFAVAGMGRFDAREFTYRWGVSMGMRSGGLFRPPVGNSKWAAIERGDSISGLGAMPGTSIDMYGHWPAHEKRRAGFFRAGIEMRDITVSGTHRLYAHNRYLNGTLSRMPLDGTLAIKVGNFTNTWYVSYNDIDGMPVGATLYITTPDPVFGYLLVDATPDTDACPTCPSGYDCEYCTRSNATAVLVGSTYDASYFTISTTGSGADSLDNKYIDVSITFSTTTLCPLPNYYGADCATPCWGGASKCGTGNCSAGPSGSGYCTPCSQGFIGEGCYEDDYCDIDNLAPKNPVAGLASYYTPTRFVELATDFDVVGRQTNISGVVVSGRFNGTGVITPPSILLSLYASSGSLPGTVIWSGNVTNGLDAVITLTTPSFFDSLDLSVSLASSHPLALVKLTPGTYFISVMPVLGTGERWMTDAVLPGLQSGNPDVQRVNGPSWANAKNAFTETTMSTSSRIKVNMFNSSCIEYFTPKPNMKVLIIRVQYPDLQMQPADVAWHYNTVFGTNGNISTQIAVGSQGSCTFYGHTLNDLSKYRLTDVLNSTANFSTLVDVRRLNDATYRDTLFSALHANALDAVRAVGVDPDEYDVHFGFFPAFGDNQLLQRPYRTIKGVWVPQPSTVKLNSIMKAFGTVLGLSSSAFLRPYTDAYLQNVIWIDGGASLDPMGWPWLSPNLAGEAALTDYNVEDKYKLGWIKEGTGMLPINRTAGKVAVNLYAHNTALSGVNKSVYISEPGVAYGWWLQYYDAPSSVVNTGLSIIFSNGIDDKTFIDATPTTNNCPNCNTGAEAGCIRCNMQDTTVVPGVHYYDMGLAYFSIDVDTPGSDSNGKYLTVTITFSTTEACPLTSHYGSGCALQCPGGAMQACSGMGQCSTGVGGDGTCSCSSLATLADCSGDNACDLSFLGSGGVLHADSANDRYVDAYFNNISGLHSLGPVADFQTTQASELAGITFWGRASPDPSSDLTELYSPRIPKVVRVTFFNHDSVNNAPGSVLVQRNISGTQWITMQAGSQLLSAVTKIEVKFDPNDDIGRYTLWPGKYWVQVIVQDDVQWNSVVTANQQLGNYPDYFWDEFGSLGGSQWQQLKSVARFASVVAGLSNLELMYELAFTRCVPVYQHIGLKLPSPEVTNSAFMDFFPKEANAGETLTITFTGYIPNGNGQTSLVKIANRLLGYGCVGEADGGSARAMTANKQVQFTMSTPGVYSVCIKTEFDLDYEEIGLEALVVYPFSATDNFYGFSSCKALVAYNTTVCGCMYDQPGFFQVPMALPMDFPFMYMTAGSTPILVRQGCCTYTTDKVYNFPFIDSAGLPTTTAWRLCSSSQALQL
eukprot:GGOE01002772.1.p1 GENE.GGOE01002772.1~~GGOE01002772.1.p1  ORF type:complete len:1492 (-),score=421.94 GGOE01002772.1:347-4822(-)